MSKLAEGTWHSRDRNRYDTRGASVQHDGTGWFALVGRKARAPLSTLDAAMSAAERMLADAAKAPA